MIKKKQLFFTNFEQILFKTINMTDIFNYKFLGRAKAIVLFHKA